jgi:hypothetical protein
MQLSETPQTMLTRLHGHMDTRDQIAHFAALSHTGRDYRRTLNCKGGISVFGHCKVAGPATVIRHATCRVISYVLVRHPGTLCSMPPLFHNIRSVHKQMQLLSLAKLYRSAFSRSFAQSQTHCSACDRRVLQIES